MKKAVFITGAQTGTGYGIAEKFAKEGYDVFITSRRGAEAERAAEEAAQEKAESKKRRAAFMKKLMNPGKRK